MFYLLGVVNGHWDALVKKATVDDGLSIENEYVNKGIALVTPIDKVFNVIEQSALYRAIKAAVKKLSETPIDPSQLQDGFQLTVQFQLDPDENDLTT